MDDELAALAHGSISRYKARLVAKGFHQRLGLDVNNAFLHGNLTEDVYMTQPPGYVDKDNLLMFLAKGFLWFETSPSSLKFVDALAHRFSLKDLGPLSYFLGVEAISTSDGLFLSQHKYVRDLLAKFHLEIKNSSTPMSSTGHLTLNDGSPPANATHFQSLVGGLQYLQLTRPDIAFAINKLAQFMHAPTQTHWTATKRLLRYLKHTIHFGLTFRRPQPLHLQAY
ncbi:Retrovirus-related Pol polyprotein from transposon RE2 [Vitis vinifera]|uniref:Retrovirus-related Pol polyprotein from transposon RE2 n=1 Tax=Vitis vinifera TaxID=29760 RepID=A0A438J022_VITVI|nr:Retrovirus-related Pol polyprotein from transposon RE2 [Vitis vinifera]